MDLAPFELLETSPGHHSLVLSALDEHTQVFENAGHSGSGYSWQAVAMHLCETELEEFGDRIEFDSEAGLFCAYGHDNAALTALGLRLAQLARDHNALAALIANVPVGLWDD